MEAKKLKYGAFYTDGKNQRLKFLGMALKKTGSGVFYWDCKFSVEPSSEIIYLHFPKVGELEEIQKTTKGRPAVFGSDVARPLSISVPSQEYEYFKKLFNNQVKEWKQSRLKK